MSEPVESLLPPPCDECGMSHASAAYQGPCGSGGPDHCIEWAYCGDPWIYHSVDH